VSRARCSRWHCPPRANPMSWLAGTPCRFPNPLSASRAGPRKTRTFVTSRPSRLHPLRRPEAPSTDRSHQPRPKLAPETRPSGPPLMPRLGRRGSASDMRSHPASPCARPKPRAGFHRSGWATCRLPTSAAVRPPGTPAIRPNPAARCDGKPSRDQWHLLLRGVPAELPQARGRSGFSALSTLPTPTARRRGFTPT
jgi:hypothetical protein